MSLPSLAGGVVLGYLIARTVGNQTQVEILPKGKLPLVFTDQNVEPYTIKEIDLSEARDRKEFRCKGNYLFVYYLDGTASIQPFNSLLGFSSFETLD